MAKKKATKKAKSKKKSAKKKSAKKKASGSKASKKKAGSLGAGTATLSGGGQPLSALLTDEVVNALKSWQINFGRSGIKDLMLQLLNPTTTHTQFLQWMLAREQTYYSIIKTAKSNGETHSWVIPIVAAMAFETMFDACAAFWLAAGDPPAPDQLRQSVLDFIDFQVGIFISTVGAS